MEKNKNILLLMNFGYHVDSWERRLKAQVTIQNELLLGQYKYHSKGDLK